MVERITVACDRGYADGFALEVYTTFKTHGRTFKVVYHHNNFCSIEDKYITDGRLNTPLYMAKLHPAKSLTECMKKTADDCKCDELINQGIPPMIAAAMAATGLDEETVRSQMWID